MKAQVLPATPALSWRALLATPADSTALVLRVVLGVVMLPHGLQKTFGMFGGFGFEGTMGYFTGKLGIPAFLALGVILIESIGAVALILGLGTRLMALGTGVVIAVGALMSHAQNGFFMNWFGNQEGEGIEFHLLVVAMAIALVIRGGGLASMDRKFAGSEPR